MSHRFTQILDLFGLWIKSHADFADDADFFLTYTVGDFADFLLDIWEIFLSIMVRKNLCKSVESVGLLN